MRIRFAMTLIIFAVLSVFCVGVKPAHAQITIKLPKLPKIFREKPAEPNAETTRTESSPVNASGGSVSTSAQQPERTEEQEVVSSCDRGRSYVHLEDLAKTKKEATGYVPGQREYYVSILSHKKNEYLEAALLPWARKEWFKDTNDEFINCLTPALDDLAAVARKSLPTYTGPKTYTSGTPAEKKLLHASIPDIAKAKVFMTGVRQANWLIEKDSYNFPTSRYKHGAVVFMHPDQEYCWVYYINIVQDYAGGGTYGASYGNYVGRSLSGCPAGK